MELSALLHEVEMQAEPVQEVEISGITDRSADVQPGDLFVCIPGRHADGHAFAAQAAERGTVALVVQAPLPLRLPQVVVPNPRRAFAQLCANFYGRPAARMQMIAVTGTNGKTTTAWLLRRILAQNGRKTGLIGTIACVPDDASASPIHYTTPDPPSLHRQLRDWAAAGAVCVVMEASSQAIAQERLAGIDYSCGVFTNLSPEHLDYHGTMESYYQAKRALFDQCACAVVNIDSPWGARLTRELPCRVVTVSARYPMADYVIDATLYTASDTEFTLTHHRLARTVRLPMVGAYNAMNAACAIAAAAQCGVPMRFAAAALESAPPIPGRMEPMVPELPFRIFLDYAHTPEALEQVLTALRGVCTSRLIAVFGCGGDRDRAKRPLMGAIGGRLADWTILTSDNPRTEPPEQILDEIEAGIADCPHDRIADRAEAIRAAVRMAQPGDCVLIAGKGHEQYQILGAQSHPFDERQIIHDAAKMWKQERNIGSWNH